MRVPIEDEWATADLGHAARTKRVQAVGRRWAQRPGESFPKMVDNDAELQGLYGLFENEEVDYPEILAAHARATLDRIDDADTREVLVIHDTTEFSFGGTSIREGLGWIARNTQGFCAHIALALSTDGTARPFGVVGLSTIMRERPPPKSRSKKPPHDGKKTCTDPTRESLRWGKLVDETSALLRGHAVPIHLTDREADSYEYLSGRVRQGQRFIARVRVLNRPVTQPHDPSPTKLHLVAERAVPVIARKAKISRRAGSPFPAQRQAHPPRGQRVAHLEFAAERLRIPRPKHLPSELGDFVDVNLVHAREPNPPPDAEPVEWLLLTSEPIDTAEQILRVVDHYRARWTIEELNQAIKTGCQYESRQLESAHALLIALAICIPVAWQMLALRHQSRVTPDAPATTVISEQRLDVLQTIARKPLPKSPTVLDVFLAIAALGGHIARNGPPGWKTLRLGLEDLIRAEEAIAAHEARRARGRSGFDE
jgi:hypothetical protein